MAKFPKGLTHGLCQKIAIFPTFFFRKYRPGKCLLRYSRTTKTPFYAIKTRSSKSRKIAIFPTGLTHGFSPKMAFFPTFFFSGNIIEENVFYDILQRKNAVLSYKNKKFESRKIDIFPKGLTHGFSPKMTIFPSFFVQAIYARKMSFTIF